jgi:hypothetical protein
LAVRGKGLVVEPSRHTDAVKLARLVALIGYPDEDEQEPRPSLTWLLVQLCGIGFLGVAIGISLFTSLGT